jgi:predicted RND superfamily exporter protein
LNRFAYAIAKFPVITLVVVLIISGILIGYMVSNTSFETEEEDFNPDSEIAQANSEVQDNYNQNAYFVQVIAKGDDDDVLTHESMMDILTIEETIVNDPVVGPTMMNTAAFPTGINSLADMVLLLNDTYSGLDQIYWGLEELNQTLADINESLNKFIFFMDVQINESNVLEMAFELSDIAEQFQFPDDIEMPDEDNRTNMQKMEAFSTDDIKDILYRALNFNKSQEAQPILSKASEADDAKDDFAFTKNQLIEKTNEIKTYPNASDPIPELGNESVLNILDHIIGALNVPLPETSYIVAPTFVIFDYVDLLSETFPKLLSRDFKTDVPNSAALKAEAAIIMVQLNRSLMDEDDEVLREAEERIQDISKEDSYQATEMKVLGMFLITEEIGAGAQSEMSKLILIALILLLIILAITYKSITDMIISFIGIILAISWTFGFAAIMGYTFNAIMIAVPILIIGLGVDYGIHLTLRYKEELTTNGKGRKEAVRIAIFFVGSALVLATITTCLSFLSNLTSEMELIRRFGILSAVGIVSSFIIMITFIPSVKQLVDTVKEKIFLKKQGEKEEAEKKYMPKGRRKGRIVKAISIGSLLAKKSSVGVIIVALLLTGISLFGAMQLETRFEFEDFLPEKSETAKNYRYAIKTFDFSTDYSYILIKGDDLADADLLIAVNETMNNMMDDQFIETTDIFSIVTLIKDVATDERSAQPTDLYNETFARMCHDSCLGGGSGLPETNITEIFTWLYTNSMTEGSARRALHMDEDSSTGSVFVFDGMLITANTKTNLVEEGDDLLNELNEDKRPLDELEDEGVIGESVVTGGMVVTKATMDAMNRSQYRSIALTVAISAVILTIVFFFEKRSFVLGLITTLPIVFVISWILGGMYLLGYNLNVLTITVGALTIGLGVTYAIHVTHRFIEELEKQKDIDKALDMCLENTGMALFGAAATTVGGFIVLWLFSTLPPMQQFGAITAMSITFSLISSIVVLPSMLRIWARVREDKGSLFKDEDFEEVVQVRSRK